MKPDLYEAQLQGAKLHRVNLNSADLSRANLHGAELDSASLRGANLPFADLSSARLDFADLLGAKLQGANLTNANLSGADLTDADLWRANLTGARLIDTILMHVGLVETTLEGADLTGARVYGVSVWNANLEGTVQSNLVITPITEPEITVDNLAIAQFIYLLLESDQIRRVIDTITSKLVLILGRFTPERKAGLDAIREELRRRDYLPVLFDFEKPATRDITETVSTLAHMARFVIADITDARSIPQELMRIVPALPSVPVQPILLAADREYGMFEHFRRFHWVLEPFLYSDVEELLASLIESVIVPAEEKVMELRGG